SHAWPRRWRHADRGPHASSSRAGRRPRSQGCFPCRTRSTRIWCSTGWCSSPAVPEPVSRLLFFLLLVAVAALGAHLYLAQPPASPDLAAREVNRDSVKIVAVTPPQLAAREAE